MTAAERGRSIIDKRDVLTSISRDELLSIELGCGGRKRDPQAIGVDLRDSPSVDIVGDAVVVLERFPPGSAKSITSEHFLEHVDDLEALLHAAARTLTPGGRFSATVPHHSSPYFYSDPTHLRSFGLYTFSYLVESSLFSFEVPHYGATLPFVLEDVSLGFKSPRPFVVRYAIKRAIGAVFNLTRYLQEFYEENLSSIFPCYEVTFELRRRT